MRFQHLFVFLLLVALGCSHPQGPKPDDYQAHYQRAIELGQFQDWQNVLKVARAMKERWPNRAQPYLLTAQALCQMDLGDEAVSDLESSIRLGATWDRVHSVCGKALAGKDNLDALRGLSETLEAAFQERSLAPMLAHRRTARHFADIADLRGTHAKERRELREETSGAAPRVRDTLWWDLLDQEMADVLFMLSGNEAENQLLAEEVATIARRYETIDHGPNTRLRLEGMFQLRQEAFDAVVERLGSAEDLPDAVLSLNLVSLSSRGENRALLDACGSVLNSGEDSCFDRVCRIEIARLCRLQDMGADQKTGTDCGEFESRVADIFAQESQSAEPLLRWIEDCSDQLSSNELRFFKSHILKSAVEGRRLPDFTGDLARGIRSSLSDQVGSGVTVVEFWASWCAPCLENIEKLKAFRRTHQDLAVVGINIDRTEDGWDRERVEQLAKKLGVDWSTFVEPEGMGGPICRSTAVTEIPTSLVVNAELEVLDSHLGLWNEEFVERLEALMSK